MKKVIRELIGRMPLEKIEQIVAERLSEVLRKAKREKKSPEEALKILNEMFGLGLKRDSVEDIQDFFGGPH